MVNIKVPTAPVQKAVHPRPVRFHGLLGSSYLRQHMQIDDRWSANSLIDEFHGMTDLLSKRLVFSQLEGNAYRKLLRRATRQMRMQCRNGRCKLQNVLQGDNVVCIRNFLINHKDMQRLYQKMSVHQVVDNINQRTFVIRKERDRLNHRLSILKSEYKAKLLERASLENRIKYENEFVLEEEHKMHNFRKEIENSSIRLRAIKTINSTYRRIIQVLRHDQIFYEPIMRSLCRDIDDQAGFINHILALGIPAISKFKQLSEDFRVMNEKMRRNNQQKMQSLTGFKIQKSTAKLNVNTYKTIKEPEFIIDISKRYTRETKSLLKLKGQLEDIETIIKKIKMETLCSKATEIYPRIRTQIENNKRLMRGDEVDTIQNEFLIFKDKVANEQQFILLYNFFRDEENRLKRIEFLDNKIKEEDDTEAQIIQHIKNRSKIFVLIRYALWNLSEIVKHVDPAINKINPITYSTQYLKLPLLKFDMMDARSYAPKNFEANPKIILNMLEKKIKLLMNTFATLVRKWVKQNKQPLDLYQLKNKYHEKFTHRIGTEPADGGHEKVNEAAEDVFKDVKILQSVPNRKQIKAQSAKIVEELSKKED